MLTFSLPNGSSVSDRYIRYDFPLEKKKNKDEKFSKYVTYLVIFFTVHITFSANVSKVTYLQFFLNEENIFECTYSVHWKCLVSRRLRK